MRCGSQWRRACRAERLRSSMNPAPPVDIAERTSTPPAAADAGGTAPSTARSSRRAVPPAVRGPPRAPGRRHPDGADRREGVGASRRAPARSTRAASVSARSARCRSPTRSKRASAAGQPTNTFEGKGSTENSNDFTGTITATVTGVLPNGHLLIAGEKQIGVNHNVDVLRFSGQVDPRHDPARQPRASAQIANVRIEHRGRGGPGRRAGNRLARPLLFERSADLKSAQNGSSGDKRRPAVRVFDRLGADRTGPPIPTKSPA
jgi:flagellar L-ring protein precursor FlgH